MSSVGATLNVMADVGLRSTVSWGVISPPPALMPALPSTAALITTILRESVVAASSASLIPRFLKMGPPRDSVWSSAVARWITYALTFQKFGQSMVANHWYWSIVR